MVSKQIEYFSIINGVIATVLSLLAIYAFVVIASFGVLLFSGVYFSLSLLSTGVVGFIVVVLLHVFRLRWKKILDIAVLFGVNASIYFLTKKEAVLGVEQYGDSTIIRHQVADTSSMDFDNLLISSMVSILLIGIYYLIESILSIHRLRRWLGQWLCRCLKSLPMLFHVELSP